jgi:predicted transcriptional regulator
MSATVDINPQIMAELEKLALSTSRDQSELVNEAIRLYLDRESRMIEKITMGLAQAERGEFVPEAEMESFFAKHAVPDTR